MIKIDRLLKKNDIVLNGSTHDIDILEENLNKVLNKQSINFPKMKMER